MSVSAYVPWDGCRHVLRAPWTNIAATPNIRASSASPRNCRPSSSTGLGLHQHRRRLHLQNLQHPRVPGRSVFRCLPLAVPRPGGGCLAFPCSPFGSAAGTGVWQAEKPPERCRYMFRTVHGEVQTHTTQRLAQTLPPVLCVWFFLHCLFWFFSHGTSANYLGIWGPASRLF
jgi:hypothetical protein